MGEQVRVHVGRHNLETIREAARTLGSADIEYALDCLESQATLRELAWGPVELFVEVTLLPQANERHTQCDLIVCFRDRAAVIDIKRKKLKGVELQRTRNQIAGQRKAIGRRAYAAGWDEQCAVPMVFVPQASAQDIAELRMALDADQDRHFVVAGNLRDTTFLPTVCMNALTGYAGKRRPQDGHLATVIRSAIKHDMWRPSFPSIAAARKAVLEHAATFPEELPQESWHIPGLRAEEILRGQTILEGEGILEVIGVPGSGRSAFVRELGAELNQARYRELRDYPVRQMRRAEDIARMVWADVTGEQSALGADTLLARLARKPVVLWISAFDTGSAKALGEIAARARASFRAVGQDAAAYWIFESTVRAVGAEETALHLRPMDLGTLYAILERAGDPGDPTRDMNETATRGNGLPGLTLRLWHSSSDVLTSQAQSTHGVLEDQLRGLERNALPFVALAAAHAPLETSIAFLNQWLDAALPALGPEEAKRTIASLLGRLQSWAIVRVDAPPQRSLELLLGDRVAGRTPPGFVMWLDVAFLEYVLDRAGEEWRVKQLGSLQEHLVARLGKGGSLPDVTAALLLGDLRPFINSSFRYTHLPACLRWLRSEGDSFNSDEEQRALVQILSVFGQLATLGDADGRGLSNAIERIPVPTSTTERMLALLRARFRTELNEGRAGLDRWRAHIERERDADVRCESLIRLATAYRRVDFPRLAFDTLFSAYEQRLEASPAVRGLILYSVLANLNRRQLLGFRAGPGRDANRLVSEAAGELAVLALSDENVVSLANALFYRCRGAIQADAGSRPRKSLEHLETLSFVERVAPMRRLQSLLTQASVSRYVCSNGAPEWPEFRERARHASLCLRRSHAAAEQRSSSTHLLNATSYLLEVCSRAPRYASNPDARRDLPAMGEVAARMAESTSRLLERIALLPGDALAILPTVKLLYPLAVILRECKFSEWAPGAETRLRDPLIEMRNALDGMLELTEEKGGTVRRALQAYVDLVEGLRVLGALRQAERAGVTEALNLIGQRVLTAKGADARLAAIGQRLASTKA